jgi:hypothetical protein
MTKIPYGWHRAGSGIPFLTKFQAIDEMDILHKLYPSQEFKPFLDKGPSPAYDRWIIITDKNPSTSRKHKSRKPKTKRCKCK